MIKLLYIDPGTGSMLFALVLSLSATAYFLFQRFLLKIKLLFRRAGSGVDRDNDERMSFVIFTDDKRYWEMFKPICDEFESRKRNIVYWTCSEDDPGLKTEYQYVKTEYIGDIYKASIRLNRMHAGVCLSTTPGLDVYQWKRSKNTGWYVHLMHGAGDALAYKMFGLDAFDAVLAVGEHQCEEIREIERERKLAEKEILVAGEPHMDYLKNRLEGMTEKKKNQTTVLLAPSWGESAILARYGEKMIEALVQTGYRIIIRPHPQTITSEKDMLESLMEKYKENKQLEWNFDNDNFDVLYESDIMVSDFSSVIWDYALVFDKPVIYADVSFDPTPYDLAWLERERWDFKVLPEIGCALPEQKISQIKGYIDKAIASEKLSQGREKIRKEAWGNRGISAIKVADYMICKYDKMSDAAKCEPGRN